MPKFLLKPLAAFVCDGQGASIEIEADNEQAARVAAARMMGQDMLKGGWIAADQVSCEIVHPQGPDTYVNEPAPPGWVPEEI